VNTDACDADLCHARRTYRQIARLRIPDLGFVNHAECESRPRITLANTL
jgi:hypothetical protein